MENIPACCFETGEIGNGKDNLNPSLMQHVVLLKGLGNRQRSKACFMKLQTGVKRKLIVLYHLARKEAEMIDDLLAIPSVSLPGQVCFANSTYEAMHELCRNCISGLGWQLQQKGDGYTYISQIHHLDIQDCLEAYLVRYNIHIKKTAVGDMNHL